ncbi:MAG: nucleotide exchange factor GrpE [Clostridia bacterium]|jgi:molecular chaperone GrpE|nr:nucleotide exchange factor GrpE [Clostridia bacterium]
MSKKKKDVREPEQELKPETQEAAAEETGETAEAEAVPEEVNPLQAELDAANAKTAEYLAMAQRVQADFENFRKRNESVRADAYSDGKKDAAAAMLPVLDNLERAADAAADSADEALKNGVQLVLKQMTEVYQKMNVTPIDRLGEKFDPNLENAILQGTEDEGEPGTVCQVLQKGYRMGDKVLRHAMVKVVPE